MFDSLKEKLGSFRKDVEETAEEKADAADADAETDAAEADAAADADTEADVDAADADAAAETPDATAEQTEPDADAAAAESATAADQAAAGADGTATATEPESAPEPADADAESREDADESATGSTRAPLDRPDASERDEEKSGGAGLGSKVKSFATGQFVIEEADIEEPLWELEMALLESDVEMSVAEEIVGELKRELAGETRGMTTTLEATVQRAMHDALLSVISVGQFDFEERIASGDKPLVVVFSGVNGVGKTTTIAKMARYLEERGYSSVLANGDTYRAGANEQLREHAEALDKKCIAHEQGGDPAAVIYDAVEYADANDIDVVLGDTAGRLHTNEGLMDQLEKIDRVVGPDMTLFVDEAVAGQDAVQRAKKFNDAAEIDGAILTKADADSQGGAAISIAHVTGKPILFLGTGQGYDHLTRFDPEELVDSLVGE